MLSGGIELVLEVSEGIVKVNSSVGSGSSVASQSEKRGEFHLNYFNYKNDSCLIYYRYVLRSICQLDFVAFHFRRNQSI